MNVQKQLMSAAIRAEAKRHEGVKLHLNKVFRLVEHVSDQPLKNNIKASLSIVRVHFQQWPHALSSHWPVAPDREGRGGARHPVSPADANCPACESAAERIGPGSFCSPSGLVEEMP
ncbi:unnamed protein product [Caretta caretta]